MNVNSTYPVTTEKQEEQKKEESGKENLFKEEYQKYRVYKDKTTDLSGLVDLNNPTPEQLAEWGVSLVA